MSEPRRMALRASVVGYLAGAAFGIQSVSEWPDGAAWSVVIVYVASSGVGVAIIAGLIGYAYGLARRNRR
jgi:hypothetical protein